MFTLFDTKGKLHENVAILLHADFGIWKCSVCSGSRFEIEYWSYNFYQTQTQYKILNRS